MEESGTGIQDEMADIALDIMRSFRSLDQNIDGQALSKLGAVVEKLFLQASNMANELDENRERISELCQQVEEYLERNGKLRDELRSLKDAHEVAIITMENEHGKEMQDQKKQMDVLKTANNRLRDRNQQLISDILELEDSNQRHEVLVPQYESAVSNLKKDLEGLQKAVVKSDRSLEEARSFGENSPVVKLAKTFTNVSVQANFPSRTTEVPELSSDVKSVQDTMKEKASKLLWLSQMKEGLSNAISHLDPKMTHQTERLTSEFDVSLAEEMKEAHDGWKSETGVFVQEPFPAKDFKIPYEIRIQPTQQDRAEFFQLKGWSAKLKWVVRLLFSFIFHSVVLAFLKAVKRTLMFFTRTRRSFCVLRRSPPPGSPPNEIVRRRMGFSRSPKPNRYSFESQTV